MVTCKDCIHYDICIFHIKGNENEKCIHFKPTADVVEVKRGEWEKTQFVGRSGFYNLKDVICSECKACCSFLYEKKNQMNFCPNCGAIMNGGKEE